MRSPCRVDRCSATCERDQAPSWAASSSRVSWAAPRAWRSQSRRRRPIRVWAKNWVPQRVRTFVRNRLLFVPRPKKPLDRDTRRMLVKVFEKDVQELEGLLGRDLSAWRRAD